MIKALKSPLKDKVVKKRAIIAFLLVTIAFAVTSHISSKLVLALGGSVPYHIFVKSNKPPTKGDYVVIATSPNDKFAKGKVIVKRIMCVEGEILKISNLDYYCCKEDNFHNCIFLGKAKTRSQSGEPVTPFNPCGETLCTIVIPEGKYFVINNHKDSYDSRYYGFVSKTDDYKILYTVKPLF